MSGDFVGAPGAAKDIPGAKQVKSSRAVSIDPLHLEMAGNSGATGTRHYAI